MTEQSKREIRAPGVKGGVVRLTEETHREQAPAPEVQERVRRDMERSRAIAENEAQVRAEQEARDREARFADALERHVEDRRRFYELRGVPSEVFESELRPEIERKFLTGEKDHVQEERERRASSVY
jgi:hypothetical protein